MGLFDLVGFFAEAYLLPSEQYGEKQMKETQEAYDKMIEEMDRKEKNKSASTSSSKSVTPSVTSSFSKKKNAVPGQGSSYSRTRAVKKEEKKAPVSVEIPAPPTNKVKKIPYAIKDRSQLDSSKFLLINSTLYCISKSGGTHCKFDLSLLVPEAPGVIPTAQPEKKAGRVCRTCGYAYGDAMSCPRCGTRYFTFGGK